MLWITEPGSRAACSGHTLNKTCRFQDDTGSLESSQATPDDTAHTCLCLCLCLSASIREGLFYRDISATRRPGRQPTPLSVLSWKIQGDSSERESRVRNVVEAVAGMWLELAILGILTRLPALRGRRPWRRGRHTFSGSSCTYALPR